MILDHGSPFVFYNDSIQLEVTMEKREKLRGKEFSFFLQVREREREIYMDQLMLDSSLTKVRFEGIGLVEVEEESPPVAVVAVEGTSGNHHGVMYAKHRNKTDRFG